MQLIDVNRLKPHPRNAEFFDDITGDAWETFKESIKTSGVIEPVIATNDNIIVSGHQRVRACKELGVAEIMTDFRDYKSDDAVIKDLIETNIRQRGVGNTNPVKFGRCLMELERIYGIQNGVRNDRKNLPNYSEGKSQENLASELGMSVDTIANYKKLAQAIPEMQSLVESGKVTKSVALSLIKRLSEDEQRQLVEALPKDEKALSKREIEFYTNRIKKLTEENDELRNKPVETVTETVEVVPDDYEELKKDKTKLEDQIGILKGKIAVYESSKKISKENEDRYEKLKSDISFLTEKKESIARQIESATELSELTVRIQNILETELAPIKFKRCMDEIPKRDVAYENLVDIVNKVSSWCSEMSRIIGQEDVVVDFDYEEN